MAGRPRVVIIGGGFGGLYTAVGLGRVNADVTLVDRRNFHLFQPLLYQVATGGLSPANIASPLRSVLRRQKNTRVLMAEVTDIDLTNRKVFFTEPELTPLSYDYLVVSAGARHHYFGHPEWELTAPGLKTIEDATVIRRKALGAFEEAERETDPARAQALLTFLVVGGGPTGIELAGALAELAHYTLRGNFRSINPARAEVLLLEAGPRILPTYPEDLSAKTEQALIRLGVTVRTNTMVTDVQPGQVTTKIGDHVEVVRTHTVLWAAGVDASPLCLSLARQVGSEIDRSRRVSVLPNCSLPGHPEVYVIGDMANFALPDGTTLPGVAPVAIQQGQHVARCIGRQLRGEPTLVFHYHDKGSMATIGRAAAVAQIGKIHLSGRIAWMAWLFIHIMYLIAFENRILVLTQWAWNYFTRNRSARLITWRGVTPPIPSTPPPPLAPK
jgi:NADH:ubiquinone reductase (H+-translocating)